MKKKYAQLLYQETVWLQDAGYCYPWQAVKEVRGMSMDNHEAVAFIKEESSPAVHKEKQGRIWEGFFLARRAHDLHLDGAAHTAVVSSFLTVLSNK